MLKRTMPSPAMAVALAALFVSLGSGTYARRGPDRLFGKMTVAISA
jgi:hypothetical protein